MTGYSSGIDATLRRDAAKARDRAMRLLHEGLGLTEAQIVSLNVGDVHVERWTITPRRPRSKARTVAELDKASARALGKWLTFRGLLKQGDGHAGEPVFISLHWSAAYRRPLGRLSVRACYNVVSAVD